MLSPDNSEGRPLAGPTSNADNTDLHIVAPPADISRCRECGHAIWSDLSVMLGIGPECRKRAA